MIKRFLLTFSLIAMLNLIAIGQDCPPKELIDVFNNCDPELGNDTSCVLNEFESDFLNLLYQNERGTFNFTGKRVAFFAGINGAGKITKEQYFSTLKKWGKDNDTCNQEGGIKSILPLTRLFIFDKKEALKVGFDAVVFCGYTKRGIPTKKNVIRRLKK